MKEFTTQIFSTRERLPRYGQYVNGYFPYRSSSDSDDPIELHKWAVVKFVPALAEGNNKRCFEWQTFGPMTFFGQDCSHWHALPDPIEDLGC